ncbi:hypothetical protein DRE_04251 [Drechslerella stenobrocha 248]|uniref:Uncharacterized protein n=1 Tax=Drechslerella stenobrocha 248 TaxID=1043628 RepID=W7I306_9PEZI|nr:hypothetical protein DRE_04251 [Drechslerella stenobrocha 248]
MAYRVPQQHRQQAASTAPHNLRDRPLVLTGLGHSATTESEEWVVFSPSSDAQTVRTPTSGRISRISDLASLQYDDDDELEEEEDDDDEMLDDDEEEEDEDEDEDEDYDEDIDLHGFRDLYHQGPVMLPQHDGLGTFPSALSKQETSTAAGRSGEQNAPVLPTRNSFTNARIQAWRMEQSRILLDEIERATKGRLGLRQTEAQRREEELASMGDIGLIEANERALADHALDQETFWERLRKRLVQDIMGLDDMVLQIIFGEALPVDLETSSGASTPTGPTEKSELRRMDALWEERLFERLARELGVLAQYYTPDVAKAAFSTYVTRKPQGASTATATEPKTAAAKDAEEAASAYSLYPSLRSSRSSTTLDPLASTRQFRPTIDGDDDQDTHAANWGIEDGPLASSLLSASSEARVDAEIVRDYWEKELNVRMLFSYLKSKLGTTSAGPSPTSPTATATRTHRHSASLPSTSATAATAATAAATAGKNRYSTLNQPLHHQHPLISHALKANMKTRRISPIASLTSALGVGMGGLRSSSSCASQSTTRKSSGQKKPDSKGTVSSKHFWDVGSAVGSSRSSCVGGPVWADV